MALKVETKDFRTGSKIFVYDEQKPKDKFLTCEINTHKKEINFYPRYRTNDVALIEKITIEGFSELPGEFAEKGYIKAGVLYYLNKHFKNFKLKSFKIVKEGKTLIKKNGLFSQVTIAYSDFLRCKKNLTSLNNESKNKKNNFIVNFLAEILPKYFKSEGDYKANTKENLMNSLDEKIIPKLSKVDIEKIQRFSSLILDKKYSAKTAKSKLITEYKIKVDLLTVDEIIKEFQEKLSSSSSEASWSDFLRKNLFLIDSKYIKVIPELNVVLAGSRKVDFGLVDSEGYLDIFEIKKPKTKLLSAKTDRGNYYFHSDTTKALAQLEKYLNSAESKAAILAQDISREKGIEVEVVKPRAVLLIGSSVQLDTKKKKTDFRILKTAFKNIEIVLYDELLTRLKNQKNKIYKD